MLRKELININKMNGFTKVKINKFESWCCNTWDGYGNNGVNYCMAFIILGGFLLPWLIVSFLLYTYLYWNPDLSMGMSFFVLFAGDLFLGYIGLNAKDKYDYNEEIENNAQMNLFRDFNIDYKIK